MTDLSVPSFLKRSKKAASVDQPLSNVPSTPQAPEKAPKVIATDLNRPKVVPLPKKPRRSKQVVRDNPPPKQTAPAKRAKSVVTPTKKPAAKPRETVQKVIKSSKAVIQEPVKLDPEDVATAKAGHLPVPPTTSDKSSAKFKLILANLITMVKKGDVQALRAHNLTDRMALRRYRDLAVIALTSK